MTDYYLQFLQVLKDHFHYKLLGWTPHITQAGVSLGLIQLIQNEFNYWEHEIIGQVSIILISSIIISQFVGPPIFKWALNFLKESNRRKKISLSKIVLSNENKLILIK